MMGIFFVSLGIGAFLSGKIAYLTAITDLNMSIIALKAHYAHAFKQLLMILLVATGCCVVINLIIHRLLLTKLNANPHPHS
jgi:POT family proton-dependent oligopeptide transporter